MTRVPAMREGPFSRALPPETRRLVAILGGYHPDPISRLDEDAVALAAAEGLQPLVGSRVAAGTLLVPDSRRESTVRDHHLCTAANIMRAHTVERLARTLEKKAIPVVLLKGMALIQGAFAPGERSMSDIDFLVPASRWKEACDRAIGEGFSEQATPGRAWTTRHDYVRAFATSGGVVIEIHRYVCERSLFAIDHDGPNGLFARACSLGSGLSAPAPDDLFLTLAAHAAKHTFDLPLRSFLDGIVLWRRHGFSREALAKRARQWRMEKAFDAWMAALRRLIAGPSRSADATNFAITGLGSVSATDASSPLGEMIWSHTTHNVPWQRFVRLAWLTDGLGQWLGHVAARSLFRTADVALSVANRRNSS